ncbi:hypothetical protein MAH1_31830 [Sessilibacter sp. MAH1]
MKQWSLVWLLFFANTFSHAAVDDLFIIALSPQDGRAVVRLTDKTTKIIDVGAVLFDATVVQVLSDKIVLKDFNGELIWLFKSENDQLSRVQRFHRTLPESEVTIGYQIAQ